MSSGPDVWDTLHMRTVTVQITQSALGLSRAATLMERLRNSVLFLGATCSAISMVVPIPTAFGSCTSEACGVALVVAIVASFISTILTLIDGKINAGENAASLHLSSQALMRLGRTIDAELHKPEALREKYSQFLDKLLVKYDGIMKNIESVPQLFLKDVDIVNLTLLRRYSELPPP